MGLGFVWYWLVYWWWVLLVYGYQLQQQKIKDIKAQLDALRQDL
jgi:hypothetical protein